MLRQALTAVIVGSAVSVPTAIVTLKLLAHWLPDVADVQLMTALPAVGILALVGAIAAALPAFRATRLDPIVALRAD